MYYVDGVDVGGKDQALDVMARDYIFRRASNDRDKAIELARKIISGGDSAVMGVATIIYEQRGLRRAGSLGLDQNVTVDEVADALERVVNNLGSTT